MQVFDNDIGDNEDFSEFAFADWKASPAEVLKSVDEQLKAHGLQVMLLEDGSDTYAWRIELRQEGV